MPQQLSFDGRNRYRVDDTQFVFSYDEESTPTRFSIAKSRALVAGYVELCQRFRSSTIVELGIAAGGSTALISMLAEPRRLIALELNEQPVSALTEFIDARGLSDVVRPYYGVDQADRERLAAIMDSELVDMPVDLVIDDASHRLAETRSSFESLFPRLRPGGLFVIEDWNSKHLQADAMRKALSERSRSDRPARESRIQAKVDEQGLVPRRPLSRLLIELMLARASSGQAIEDMTIGEFWAVIRRGPASLDPKTFRVADLYHDHFGLAPD